MKYTLKLIVFILFISIVGCKAQNFKPSSAIPVSDLAHIDVILDSTTFYAIKEDSFMKKEFGVFEIDTMYYGGKPSYDLYILGHHNFLHFSLAKGFWENQQGGGVLVFQTRKPNMKEGLLTGWKQFYKDSLSIHTYKATDFSIDEVMAWYKTDTLTTKESRIFANLTSFSEEAYHNWGITDSIIDAGLSMKKFMADWGGNELDTKLFQSITELHMTINQKEFREIKSSLLANGYEEHDNVFSHSFNPKVYITVNKEKGNPKYSKVKFSLTKPVEKRELVFSRNTKLQLNGDEAWFFFN